jgi:hypothetical protein
MRIIYRITEEDFMESHRLYVANEKWIRRTSRRINPWLGGLLVPAGIGLLILTRQPVNMLISAFGGLMLYSSFALRRMFRKRFRGDRRYDNEITTEISDDGLHMVMSTSDSNVKWNAIIRSLESDKIFMLFFAEYIFAVLPKRAFAPGDVDVFREVLHRNTSVSTKLL